MTIYSLLNKLLGVYALFLVLSGTCLNLVNFLICVRVRNNNTFVFLAFFALSNLFTLYWWNLNNFLKEFLAIDLLNVSLWLCKLGNYVQFSSLQITAWLLVLISLERVLSVFFKHCRSIHFKKRQALASSILLTAFFLLLNLNILFTFGVEAPQNATLNVYCFEVADSQPDTQWMSIYGQIHLVLYSIVPFVILVVLNILLIFKLKNSRRKSKSNLNKMRIIESSRTRSAAYSKSKRKYNRINRIVISITFSFILSTLPIACASFFFSYLEKTDYGQFLIVLLDSLSMSYHAFNILISYFSNKIFKKEMKRFFRQRQYYNCSSSAQFEI